MTNIKATCIILINYNCELYILNCLNSITSNNFKTTDIIIVDNNSQDNSVKNILSAYPDINIVYSKYNLGFSGGNNLGIKLALTRRYKNIILLNPDTVLDDDFIIELHKSIEEKCLLVPFIKSQEGENIVFNNVSGFNFITGRAITRSFDDFIYKTNENNYLLMSSACAILLPDTFFKDVGYFDENYFLYWEDTDLLYRGIKCGYKIKFVESSKLYHEESSSTGGKFSDISVYYNYRNRLYFMRKHKKNHLQYFFFLCIYSTTTFTKILQLIINGKIHKVKIIFKAILDFKNNNLGYNKF